MTTAVTGGKKRLTVCPIRRHSDSVITQRLCEISRVVAVCVFVCVRTTCTQQACAIQQERSYKPSLTGNQNGVDLDNLDWERAKKYSLKGNSSRESGWSADFGESDQKDWQK